MREAARGYVREAFQQSKMRITKALWVLTSNDKTKATAQELALLISVVDAAYGNNSDPKDRAHTLAKTAFAWIQLAAPDKGLTGRRHIALRFGSLVEAALELFPAFLSMPLWTSESLLIALLNGAIGEDNQSPTADELYNHLRMVL